MILYHVTTRENAESILREGLEPRTDPGLTARFLPKHVAVVNLVDRELLDDVYGILGEEDSVVIRVDIPRSEVRKVTHSYSTGVPYWYIARRRIPPSRLRLLEEEELAAIQRDQ